MMIASLFLYMAECAAIALQTCKATADRSAAALPPA
jgi:hypothetical protein